MIRIGEFAGFVGLALLVHVGLWLGMARPGSEAAGGGGQASVALIAATGQVADLVEAWTTPVDAAQTPVAMPVAAPPDQDEVALSDKPRAFETLIRPAAPTQVPPESPRPPEALAEALAGVLAGAEAPPAPTSVLLAVPQTSLRSVSRLAETADLPVAKPRAPRPLQPTLNTGTLSAPLAPDVAPKAPQTAKRKPVAKPRPRARPQAPAPAPAPAPSRAPAPVAKKSSPAKQKPAAQAQSAAGTKAGANAGSGAVQRPATLSKAARQSLVAKWGASIRHRVERRKRYPRGSKASGTTVLRITVARNGRLAAVSIAMSSGHKALDRAAVEAVRRARFPAAPKGLSKAQYRFNLPLAFSRK